MSHDGKFLVVISLAALLCGASLSVGAITNHEDGSVTLTKEEVASVEASISRLVEVIEKQGEVLRRQHKAIEANKSGKCI